MKMVSSIIDNLLHHCNPSVTRNLENFTTETARCGMRACAFPPFASLGRAFQGLVWSVGGGFRYMGKTIGLVSKAWRPAAVKRLRAAAGMAGLPLALAVAAGCASTKHLQEAETLYCAGQYAEAALAAGSHLPDSDGDSNGRGKADYILDNLYVGSAALMADDAEGAAEAFGNAVEGVAEQDDSAFGAGYPTRTYDVSMAANYRALALWSEGDIDATRIAYRQTADAQERADDRNARAIRKAEDEAEKRKAEEEEKAGKDAAAKGDSSDGVLATFLKAVSDGDIKKQLDDYQAEYSAWSVYNDFQMPSTWFLDGLFALANAEEANDLEHASFAARKAGEMEPSLPAKALYNLAEARADGKLTEKALDKVFAVVFENGLGPEIEERRFDIPMPYNGSVYMLSFALPKLVRRGAAYPGLIVRDGAVQIGSTVPVGDIDRVAVREFKARLPGIVASQTFEAAVKLAVQVVIVEAVKKKGGAQAAFLASLATSSASSAITGTDTRHWNLLPKEVQACLLRKPKTPDRTVELWVPGAVEPLARVSLPEKGLSVIYVKAPAPGLPPLVKLLGGTPDGERR